MDELAVGARIRCEAKTTQLLHVRCHSLRITTHKYIMIVYVWDKYKQTKKR